MQWTVEHECPATELELREPLGRKDMNEEVWVEVGTRIEWDHLGILGT